METKLAPCPFCGKPGRAIDLDVDTARPRREYGCECLNAWTSDAEKWNSRGPATAKMLEFAWGMMGYFTAHGMKTYTAALAAFVAEHEPAQPS